MRCTKCKACRNTVLTLLVTPATLGTAVLGLGVARVWVCLVAAVGFRADLEDCG